MSKRIIRIKNTDVFASLEHRTGIELNAVLQNGRTHFGVLNSITAESLVIADSREHFHKLMISDLYEIVLDTTEKLENISIK